MTFVCRGSLQFFIKKNDISIVSFQVAKFFNLSHENKLLPMINDIYKYSEHGFKRVVLWGAIRKKRYISHYHLNKEGCIIICEKIKPPRELKEEFLTLVEAREEELE